MWVEGGGGFGCLLGTRREARGDREGEVIFALFAMKGEKIGER